VTINAGAFELTEPVPQMEKPRLIMCLSPWIDVGAVGSASLGFLEQMWDATTIGQLARPGDFFDFTRYRPVLRRTDGVRHVELPNSYIRHAKDDQGRDWLFLHALEPHNRAEDYMDSVMDVTQRFGVVENCMIGSFYGPAPHTRPPQAYGEASDEQSQSRLRKLGTIPSSYEGPTSVLALATEQAHQKSIDTTRIILQLPAYAQLEQDYRGLQTMLEILAGFYGFSYGLTEIAEEATRQTAMINEAVEADPRLKRWVEEMETAYDITAGASPEEDEPAAPLSPELEDFLREAQRRMTDEPNQ
jgi:hypothetical protein